MKVINMVSKGLLFLIFIASGLWISCAEDVSFEDIGLNVAGPTAIAHLNSSHFYVLNSDFDQTFNTGSILVIDHDGEKVGVVETPRLGTVLKAVDNDLLAGFSADAGNEPQVQLFNISNPESPELEATFSLPSQPINIAVSSGYAYFAVTCANGDLYIGELKTPRSSSTLKRVRQYGYPRRAIYIDATRQLIFAFPTMDYGVQRVSDLRFTDEKTYNDDDTSTDTPNEIPDQFESSAEQRNRLTQRYPYQFIVYDIAAASAEDFAEKENDEVANEFRWMHFKLKDGNDNADFEEDSDESKNFYRTNFWEAIADPDDTDAFLLSHRNPFSTDLKKSNSVVKVKVIADPKPTGETAPLTDDTFEITRVYGFEDDQPEDPFPASLSAGVVNGDTVLLVNHYNNLTVNRAEAKFSLAQKNLSNNHTRYELEGKPPNLSYYEMALMPDGRALAGSFFGNIVLLFDIDPSTNIAEVNVTEIR